MFNPWALLGWLLLIVIVISILSAPVQVILINRRRKRALAAIARWKGDRATVSVDAFKGIEVIGNVRLNAADASGGNTIVRIGSVETALSEMASAQRVDTLEARLSAVEAAIRPVAARIDTGTSAA